MLKIIKNANIKGMKEEERRRTLPVDERYFVDQRNVNVLHHICNSYVRQAPSLHKKEGFRVNGDQE